MTYKRFIQLLLASALTVILVGCKHGLDDHARTNTGQDLGKQAWKQIYKQISLPLKLVYGNSTIIFLQRVYAAQYSDALKSSCLTQHHS